MRRLGDAYASPTALRNIYFFDFFIEKKIKKLVLIFNIFGIFFNIFGIFFNIFGTEFNIFGTEFNIFGTNWFDWNLKSN